MAVALITGTSTGIGLATALHFGRQGHDVWAGVRNPAAATELREAIERERLPVRVVALDVDDAGSVQRGVAEVLDKAGRIDVLVNNAGIGGGGPIEDVPVDWVKTLFETNYFGVLRVIQAVLPGMRERRAGAIVNVSSVAGRLAIAGHGHYSAVKHALEAMSEALAQEVQRFGIRVAIVEPGVVVTPDLQQGQALRRSGLALLRPRPAPAAALPEADAARGPARRRRRGSSTRRPPRSSRGCAGWSVRTPSCSSRAGSGRATRSTSPAGGRCRKRSS